MIKECVKCWASWGLYGYIIGPGIDQLIPEDSNGFLKAAKEVNEAAMHLCKGMFLFPIAVVEGGVSYVMNKTKKEEVKS